jgi:PKD repeat protein
MKANLRLRCGRVVLQIFFLFLTFLLSSNLLTAQPQAVGDNFCFTAGQTFGSTDNVLLNDLYPPQGQVSVMAMGQIPCLHLLDNGSFEWDTDDFSDCCGTYTMFYALVVNGQIVGEAMIEIEIKCPKPNCNLIDLNSFIAPSDPIGNPPPPSSCASVCEFSEVTFFVDYNPGNTYLWNVVSGGSGVAGANPAEFIVTWGAVGIGFISLQITDAGGNITTHVICVDILPAPIASFTSTGYACLGQSMCFNNTSTPIGSSAFWDFGDGNTSVLWGGAPGAPICHTYNTPGTYIVTLTVTNLNSDAQGNPLCCCTDTFEMEVVVDELPGPSIDCVSTLCQGDEACYTTDATNCSSYIWTVLDANGNPIVFTGQGTDSICVTWPIGPFGTITLDVTGCDSAYCSNPTTVTIPVISNTSLVSGPMIVCANSTEVYSVPKWMSTAYSWTVSGGILTGSGTGNTEPILWGSPGSGFITVNYVSTFLGGLPGQDPTSCEGVATLPVTILPEFSINNNGPNSVCLGSVSTISATASPNPVYNWTITPAHPFGGQGTSNIVINWTAPGSYVINASNTSGAYCNTSESTVIIVQDVPAPLGITGSTSICPGDIEYYTVIPNGAGYANLWSASNGTLTSTSGATVGVTWGPGGGTLSVQQVMTTQPLCPSLPFVLNVSEKGPNGPYIITGGPSCTNDTGTYSVVSTHPDVTYNWTLSDPTKGSIISGQGTNQIDIQWGNTPATGLVLQVNAELCGNIVPATLNINVNSPAIPVISGPTAVCAGGTVTLNATGGFADYSWSTGSLVSSTSAGVGNHSLTTEDANGCSATVFYQVNASPAPVANITTANNPIICIQSPHTVTLLAQTNANYQFQWFCNGVPQGPSGPNPTFVHPFAGVPGVYAYHAVVTDITTGCTTPSNTIQVTESNCLPGQPGGPDPCIPVAFTLSASATPQAPLCNVFNFNFVASNFTFDIWHFGDGNTSNIPNPSHTYTTIGCYPNVRVCGFVPEDQVFGGSGQCYVCETISLCVPVAADFEFVQAGCGTYSFTDFSTHLVGTGNNIVSHLWTTSDAQSAITPNTSFSFAVPGSYTVTLTVTTSNGCQASITKPVIASGVGTPVISLNPNPVCVGDAMTFSATAAGATNFDWTFGDGGTFSGQNGQYSYTGPGAFPVIVTASDQWGCLSGTTVIVNVNPAVPPAVISGTLIICQGDQTTLTAPAGYTYLWSPGGQLTQSIVAGQGTYSVLLTDANNCSLQLDPVDVVELPLPLATISGPLFICDAGCVTLSVPFDAGNTYQWLDDNGNPIPGETSNQIYICDNTLLPAYSAEVTDQNGCTNTAGPVTVQVAVSPSFTVNISPLPACAGTPTTLTVTPIDPNVSYVWSTGANATSIIVNQAGLYTVVGTDLTSGCSFSASATIHPLPDLCIVPEGCYEVCNPDTICGPDGYTYQWNFNNLPFSTDQCIVVTQSGTYSLTATNQFGCTTTSGDLVLTVIECPESPCDEIGIEYMLVTNEIDIPDPCCADISYTNNFGPIKGLTIFTNDADLVFSNIDPALTTQALASNSISLASATTGSPIPSGVLTNFIRLCVQNATSSPQVIIFNWYNFENEIVCTDSIVLNCPVEPPCVFLSEGEIVCDDNETVLTFTICNPATSTYPIGYVDILASSPPGVIVTPPAIDLTGSPILPGQCATVSVILSGPGIGGQQFCFNLVSHEQNPIEFPGGLCCSADSLYCFDIPICDPCPLVGVEGWVPSATEDGCCFNVMLYNNFGPGYFDEIGLNVLSPATTFTINNPFGSGWLTANYTPTSLSLIPDPIGSDVPLGFFSIPEICIQTNAAPSQQIEILWMKDGQIVCRDTISVFCEPPCGYVTAETIECNPATGQWIYTAQVKNTSNTIMNGVYVEFLSPGLSYLDQMIPLGVLNPGSISAPFTIIIGAPAMSGDTICVRLVLHELDANGNTLTCCEFEHCFVLPECALAVDCSCNTLFNSNVAAGYISSPNPANPVSLDFSMINATQFSDCDQFFWSWGHTAPQTITTGPATVNHVFPAPGSYNVCVRVRRTQPDGTQCLQIKCIVIVVSGTVGSPQPMVVYPNPSQGEFSIQLYEDISYPVSMSIFDYSGRIVADYSQQSKPDNSVVKFDLSHLSKGLYVIQFKIGEDSYSRKVVID